MAKHKIILIGGGGHCESSIDVIESTNEYKIVGIVDEQLEVGSEVVSYPVIGKDRDLATLTGKADYAIVTVGQIKSPEIRKHLFHSIKALGYKIPAIGADRSYVSKHASVGIGSMIFHHAIVNAKAVIGQNCIINTNALIEHHAVIGSHTHVSTSAVVNGKVTIGEDCFIGSNSVINHGLSICDHVIIGAGAVIVEDITEPGTYVGNPARKK
ncbi:MAG: acetyltransferase [Crocinitomicaceae bacterium]|nr:acetyltransferase [Crocinitomicaceae bacterium]